MPNEKEVAMVDLEEKSHDTSHSRDSDGTGSAAYEEASIDKFEPI